MSSPLTFLSPMRVTIKGKDGVRDNPSGRVIKGLGNVGSKFLFLANVGKDTTSCEAPR